MSTLGIDPGLGGAIAVVTDDGCHVIDMPVRMQRTGRSVCAHTLADELRSLKVQHPGLHAYVEASTARPRQGVTSTCSTCRGAGILEGVLAALEIPYTMVPPTTWKRRAGLARCDKRVSRTRAMELYPSMSDQLARVKDHGRAEALLIAHYGASAP